MCFSNDTVYIARHLFEISQCLYTDCYYWVRVRRWDVESRPGVAVNCDDASTAAAGVSTVATRRSDIVTSDYITVFTGGEACG